MKKTFLSLFATLFYLIVSAQEKVNPLGMRTSWGETVTAENAWKQYPRPQLVRRDWMSLNGHWDYAITAKSEAAPKKFAGKILVPFAAESALSGVTKPVKPDQKLWYSRTFSIPAGWKNKKILLHFEAVDWETTVWLNGKKVGEHRGGSDPFSFDISKYLKSGTQELEVSVWDPTDTGTQPRGKQVLDPKGIWYTAVTGIWQPVWLEPVDQTHIVSVIPQADIDKGNVTVKTALSRTNGNERINVKVLKNGKVLAEKSGPAGSPLEITVPDPTLWTPYDPVLYRFELTLTDGRKTLDAVRSYFAMREIHVGKDEFGYERLMLNNEPLFQYGTLDQGWWPDGLLTPPSEEAMRYDMEVLKEMGFNMLRKHIKVEPSRYYYYADSLGLLVWQDMPSGYATADERTQAIAPEAKEDWARPKESAVQFEKEWKSIMDHLRFFPSIVVWVPFNEGWGQYETERIVKWTKAYDPTRVVNGVSGWTDRNVGDMNDSHQYPGPAMEPAEQNPGRVIVLGEFGGLGLPVDGHLWNPNMRNWGYRTYKAPEQLIKEYARLIHNLHPLINRGLSAAIYTQTTDVEGEVNGLLTYDRKKVKFDAELMRMLHTPLFRKAVRSRPVFADGEVSPHRILLATSNPLEGGRLVSDRFTEVQAPMDLKKGVTRWGMKAFSLDGPLENLQLRIKTHADVSVYLNGKLLFRRYMNAYHHYDEVNLSEFRHYLKEGENQLLIGVDNVREDIPFDFGLYTH